MRQLLIGALLAALSVRGTVAYANPLAAVEGGQPSARSIWPRLVAGMQLGGEQRPEVQRFITHYRSNPEYFTAMLARAEPFLWFVLDAAEQRRLPTELALLPAVESSWNPHAVSASAAHGLWQFIPKTGAAYGLRDALNYNARRDPVASTTVALDLLAELHREYRDWPLALAAYNTGGVRLKRAIRQAGSRNFWRLPLAPVTSDYVPRLLAIAALVREPRRYGVSLPLIAESGVAELVALDADTPLHLAALAAGLNPEVLRSFNPALSSSNAPTASPTLLLPPAEAMALRAQLSALRQPSPHGGSAFPGLSARLHWDLQIGVIDRSGAAALQIHRYRVRRGDTLDEIARRHRLSLAALRRMNPDASVTELQPGQTLQLAECKPSRCG